MRPMGYMYKRVASRPEWLHASNIDDIFSVSGCISGNFADYVAYWRHNGYWMFDSPSGIEALAREHSISLEGTRLFYYEVHEEEYDDRHGRWERFEPDASLVTSVQVPGAKMIEGLDVTTFHSRNAPECSPLSCNSIAEEVPTNRHCLFQTSEEARAAIEQGVFKSSEPGPYRIIAVSNVIRAGW